MKSKQKQIRYRNGSGHELERHGGVLAKEWRRKVANSSTRPPSSTFRTLSLPLDLALPLTEFSRADSLYNTVEGFGAGSLGELLMRAHLAGLSFFPNVNEANALRQAAAFPSAGFSQALIEGMGLDLPQLTPSSIFNLFRSAPRKSPPFTAEEIASRLHSKCMGKRMDEKVDASLKEVLLAVGAGATKHNSDYKQLSENALQALEEAGKELNKLSSKFPSLKVSLSDSRIALSFAYEGVVDPVAPDSASTFLLHHIVACLCRNSPESKAAEIQDALLSFSNNALSQLFGAILFDKKGSDSYLRTVTVDEFCADTGIPDARKQQAKDLLDAAKAIPAPALFDEPHYADYRPAVAGKLRSWVSNYLSRLEVLSTQIDKLALAKLPQSTCTELDEILSGLDLSIATIGALTQERAATLDQARTNLNCLRGLSNDRSPINAAQELEGQLRKISQIHGTFLSVRNQIEQRLEQGENADLAQWKTALSDADSDIFVLPRISGGSDPVEQTIDELNGLLKKYFLALKQFGHFVSANASGGLANVIEGYAAQEIARARAVPRRSLGDDQVRELARRRVLQSIYKLSTRLSPNRKSAVIDWLEVPLSSLNAKNFNRLKFNDQGRLYKSPWSTGRHQPLPIDWQAFESIDWLERLQDLARECEADLMASPTGATLQDHVEVQRFLFEWRILCGPKAIERTKLLEAFPISDLDLHPRLELALREELVGQPTLSSLLAWLGSQLSRLRFAARRERFIVRHKFSRVGQDELLLVPKKKLWAAPAKYLDAKGPLSTALGLVESTGEPLDVELVFQRAIKHPPAETGSLLAQLPHDWYLPLDFRAPIGQEVEGLPVGKDLVRNPDKPRRIKKTQGARVRGPSSFLTQFTQMLSGVTESGEWMMILDWGHRSSLGVHDGIPYLQAQLQDCQPRVAIPIKRIMTPDETIALTDRIVAIDLGEKQIGYAVFDVRDGLSSDKPVPIVDPATCQVVNATLRVPGVRSLINSVKTHRGKQAANSKLRQNFDRRLEELRTSVAAEVVQRIEALMARYQAFPILESSVANFQTGSRQLDLVYGDVVRHFAYSGVDAHKSARQQHWMGGDRWEHAFLMTREYDEKTGKRSGRPKRLSLFPGATVNPAGTSQTCIQCTRNVITALRQLGDSVTIGNDGHVQTPVGEARLFVGSSYSEAEHQRAAREKRNLPLNAPARAGVTSLREAIGMARRSMRQRPSSSMSRDTTQSRFFCLFVDCGASHHADSGAAINIGRRFLLELIDREESRVALAKG